ncbi:DDE-type integrase/transposase/recombinase [Brevibacterium moorei]|uniref:DDE-type integrase/transposase/recombinase n=1 Tax=Brevibacterium moorei TaxID=2968457 RepID=UPI00211CE7FD|nr:DDE-type integrase/transposase/recombinase [Brevibacterium sp. 68QC2CO]MCQ9385348.1 DDE-type integrase/transposase/recombinase [Brevibacterium sp. 68QC2CO]
MTRDYKPTQDPNIRLKVAQFPDPAPHGAIGEFCTRYGVSRSWFKKIRTRAKTRGINATIEPASRAPKTRPGATDQTTIDLLLAKREHLKKEGWDHGPLAVLDRLQREGITGLPSRATVARIFTRSGVITPAPKKRPRASYHRFVWPRFNDLWQIDGMDHTLADGTHACIIVIIDDCTRMILASHVAEGETSEAALTTVKTAIDRYGTPQRFLSDNGTAFNVSRRGRIGQLTTFLQSLGVTCMTGKPGHPTTQGKNERSHQTLQKYLAARPAAKALFTLQEHVDAFDAEYNHHRGHQGLAGLTPAERHAEVPTADPPIPPEPVDTDDWIQLRKVIPKTAAILIDRVRYRIGKDHIGTTVIIMHNLRHVHVYDEAGTQILSFIKPTDPQTHYVGNGRPRGFLNDPKYTHRPEMDTKS